MVARWRRLTFCTMVPERGDEAAQMSKQAEGRDSAPRGREEEAGGRVREEKWACGCAVPRYTRRRECVVTSSLCVLEWPVMEVVRVAVAVGGGALGGALAPQRLGSFLLGGRAGK